jgi:hypothetical protein
MAMAYSLAYLVVGLAIALWGVIVPTVRCRSADFRSTVLFVYVFIAAVYHRYSVSNDPYVALGLVVIAVSWGYVYLRNHLIGLAWVYVALSVAWAAWSALLFTHRANENTFAWLAIFGVIAWAALIGIYARILKCSGDPLGFYERYKEPEDWLTWDLKKNDARD